ncbi:MAG: hypothetical protein GF317_10775, partial [Candidatus Lokiarchaeota archaeon]|nr:hypothetical protein [Candidatus Lokiarchaeota archaeon]MBD3200145.1 hypothetical protein [Candidatus Lokiarchaeota archaeon]
MQKFIFILGSNWKLSLAELDACLKSKMFKGKIVDYSSNTAIVEFRTLTDEQYFVNKLETLQYYMGGIQKIGLIYDFFPSFILENAFPEYIDNFNEVKKARKKINQMLDSVLDNLFPVIENKDIFFAVSIYPDLFDSKYYKDVLVKHFLPYLNKNISINLKNKKANKAIYFRYPEKNMKSGNLNPIFPHHVIKYELFKPNRAEILFCLTEEGCYIGRTFTSDDPNFKRKIDEERPKKDFKSSISPKLA